ncbi:pyridoxal-phosphate dependent enzyme [Candidatus Gracilibacteria bacterium]|nr:pyridoxal-phosphate dependent enzyme [Candidatus Gracilibacteria bacterium]
MEALQRGNRLADGDDGHVRAAGLQLHHIADLQGCRSLRLHGDSYDAAEAEALRLARVEAMHFISPYNHPAVIAGQGTLACEILEQLPQVDVLLVGVSGGGLIAGIGLWAKTVQPQLRLVGVQAANAPAMAESLRAGQIVNAQDLPTLADGLAGNIEPGSITFPLCQQHVDEMHLVSEAQIAAAMRYTLDEHHLVIEGAAAVVVAALLEQQIADLADKHVVALLCGRNVATATLRRVLEMTS